MKSIRTLTIGFLAAALACGCDHSAPASKGDANEVAELSLPEQAAAVREGRSTEIRVSQHDVSDADLSLLADLNSLTLLQLEKTSITDTGIAQLTELTSLEHLRLRHAALSDTSARLLSRLRRLKIVNLPHTTISDQGLAQLASLPDLELLRIGSPNIRQLTPLRTCEHLRFLHFIHCPINDQALTALHDMRQLESLYLDGAQVTDAGLQALMEANPVHLHIDQRHHDLDPRKDHTHSP